MSDVQVGHFEVLEISRTGTPERLLARLSVFDDAKAIAELGKTKSRVVVHFGEVIWPITQSKARVSGSFGTPPFSTTESIAPIELNKITANGCHDLANQYKALSQASSISQARALLLKNIARSFTGVSGQLDRLAALIKDEAK